jgi:hypothetical protein
VSEAPPDIAPRDAEEAVRRPTIVTLPAMDARALDDARPTVERKTVKSDALLIDASEMAELPSI